MQPFSLVRSGSQPRSAQKTDIWRANLAERRESNKWDKNMRRKRRGVVSKWFTVLVISNTVGEKLKNAIG